MPDYPQEIVTAAAEVLCAELADAYDLGDDALGEHNRAALRRTAGRLLDAVAEPLGEAVAGKIITHMEAHGENMSAERARTWRRHFGIAARVAARAFLTEDDLKRMAAEAFARGDYAVCPGLEGEASSEPG